MILVPLFLKIYPINPFTQRFQSFRRLSFWLKRPEDERSSAGEMNRPATGVPPQNHWNKNLITSSGWVPYSCSPVTKWDEDTPKTNRFSRCTISVRCKASGPRSTLSFPILGLGPFHLRIFVNIKEIQNQCFSSRINLMILDHEILQHWEAPKCGEMDLEFEFFSRTIQKKRRGPIDVNSSLTSCHMGFH